MGLIVSGAVENIAVVFSKRKAAKQQATVTQIAVENIMSCYASDPEQWEVRAAVVLFDAEEEGNPYGVITLGFSEDDRTAIYMDFDLTALVKDAQLVPDVLSAEAIALDWVGERGEQLDFRYLPGIYQAAYMEWATGIEQESHETHFMWALPGGGDLLPMREFPPRTGPTETTPIVGEASFVLLPRDAVDSLFATRGW